MSPPNPSPPLPSAEQLQEIRDSDATSGEDLQFCPISWQHRRDLLGYIDTLEGAAARVETLERALTFAERHLSFLNSTVLTDEQKANEPMLTGLPAVIRMSLDALGLQQMPDGSVQPEARS